MARIRSVSPDLRVSESAACWTRECRYAWVLLWGYLDDYGRGLDNARIVAADCFPLDDDVTPQLMAEWLDVWEEAGSICRYEHDGKRYLHALNWSEHQKPQHPGKERLPPCHDHEPESFRRWSEARRGTPEKSSRKSHEDRPSVSPLRGRRSKEEEREGEVTARARPEQPPRCPRHAHLVNPPSCGQCKELRLEWEHDRPALAIVLPQLECRVHRGQLAGNCRSCAADRKAAR